MMLHRAVGVRSFGGGGHGPQPKAPNGLAEVVKHPDGHDDHHHGHVHAAPLDHKFIAEGVDKKTLFFTGLKGSKPATLAIDNEFHHLNDLSMFQ